MGAIVSELVVTDQMDHWLCLLRQVVLRGQVKESPAVLMDYDEGMLISLSAKVEVSFYLPRLLSQLRLAVAESSLWLVDLSSEVSEPLEAIFDEHLGSDILATVVMSELVASGEEFLSDHRWLMMDKEYSILSANYVVDGRGIFVTLIIEMEVE